VTGIVDGVVEFGNERPQARKIDFRCDHVESLHATRIAYDHSDGLQPGERLATGLRTYTLNVERLDCMDAESLSPMQLPDT
jgi:hypothetical protein